MNVPAAGGVARPARTARRRRRTRVAAKHLLDVRPNVGRQLVEFLLRDFPFLIVAFDDDLRRLIAFLRDDDAHVARQGLAE